MAAECFSEQARERAHEVDVVVTNHALVAIDTFEGRRMLPEHDLLVLDEGHEFADRVTSVISDELSEGIVEAASKRRPAGRREEHDRLDDAATALGGSLAEMPEGRLALGLPESLIPSAVRLRDAARDLLTELEARRRRTRPTAGDRRHAPRSTSCTTSRSAWRAARPGPRGRTSPGWRGSAARTAAAGRRCTSPRCRSPACCGERLYDERTVVLTSATLALGGGFEAGGGSVGLLGGAGAPAWRGLDVGSPFDYPRQGILYVARHLPPPGRDGVSPAALDELAALVEAAGGRTLGLFSSRRAAEAAAEEMRERLDLPVLCQGEDADADAGPASSPGTRATCLFGTLSLWQGVDVPGSACQLVVIDRIPFPRPDDPLASARRRPSPVPAATGS